MAGLCFDFLFHSRQPRERLPQLTNNTIFLERFETTKQELTEDREAGAEGGFDHLLLVLEVVMFNVVFSDFWWLTEGINRRKETKNSGEKRKRDFKEIAKLFLAKLGDFACIPFC